MNRLEKDRASAADVFAVIVIVLILITAGLGIVLYQISSKSPHTTPSTVVIDEDDIVEFEYVGRFENTRKVFETSMYDVAIDNETYIKTLSFRWPETDVFEPINVTIGDGISPLDFVNFTGMIDDGNILLDEMIGMREGGSRHISLESFEAFGDPDPSKIVTLSLTETLDQVEVLTSIEFLQRMGEVEIIVNATYRDPVWGWDVRIIKEEHVGDIAEVTIRNLPTEEGQRVTPYETFESEVVSIDSAANEGKGEIVLRHLISAEDVNNLMAKSPSEGRFILVGLDESAGTFVADFNSEKAGKSLIYEVTVVKIVKR